jgi:hypothetical protein
MIQEPFFSLPVVAAPTMQDIVMPAPVVIPPVGTMNGDEDPIEPVTTHEGEQQQPHAENVPNVKAPRRSQRVRKSAILDDYEVYNTEEFHMEDDLTSYEEA